MHRHKPIACCGFVVHSHKLGAGIRINTDVSRLKLRNPFDPSTGIRGDPNGSGQRHIGSLFRGSPAAYHILHMKPLAEFLLTLSPACWVDDSASSEWIA